ncbi:uncharacterized protein PHALS_05592 [Plasmopara halstedii]|uniref:Uncharacterized protein n=1 Tax=Plasmopara halstedii TaxID=4781 RepID=A0A0P1B2T4_PLAHL|nr:uncharacterized protein PHALS_05592 [Plasmopara halstedii]CEG48118.1 hypothetical protein PHALS_05592 [Plasmopara halstedii]|eukprot:XP_024584487.1 hypothetical protein PHALS_05592 [Plasmopara halstedii]
MKCYYCLDAGLDVDQNDNPYCVENHKETVAVLGLGRRCRCDIEPQYRLPFESRRVQLLKGGKPILPGVSREVTVLKKVRSGFKHTAVVMTKALDSLKMLKTVAEVVRASLSCCLDSTLIEQDLFVHQGGKAVSKTHASNAAKVPVAPHG